MQIITVSMVQPRLEANNSGYQDGDLRGPLKILLIGKVLSLQYWLHMGSPHLAYVNVVIGT